jgi:hypothetical protein
MDLLQRRSESRALEGIADLLGHEAARFLVKSRSEFATTCKYIASITEAHDSQGRTGVPLCLHIATHGNAEGIGLGADMISWADLCRLIQPLCSGIDHYSGPTIFVISACQAVYQNITHELEKQYASSQDFKPSLYLFVSAGDETKNVYWNDLVAAWMLFYHQLALIDITKRTEVQRILDRIKYSGTGEVGYYRWDKTRGKYLRFRSKVNLST